MGAIIITSHNRGDSISNPAFLEPQALTEEEHLSQMMVRQLELMDQLGIDKWEGTYEALVEEIVHAIACEANEMVAPFIVKTKPWKQVNKLDMNHIIEESIDVMHFLMEFWLLVGMTPDEVLNEYKLKAAINEQRIKQKMAKVEED